MLFDERYKEILSQLRQGRRPLWKPQGGELAEIEAIWQKTLNSTQILNSDLIPLFCLLSYTQTLTERFDSLIVQTLSLVSEDSEFLVAVLGCLHRQVLDRCEMRGERFPPWLTENLRNLMNHDNPEIFHWCLRTIERMGSMGINLREDVLRKCPGRWESLFNVHKRSSRKIIFSLNRRWSNR